MRRLQLVVRLISIFRSRVVIEIRFMLRTCFFSGWHLNSFSHLRRRFFRYSLSLISTIWNNLKTNKATFSSSNFSTLQTSTYYKWIRHPITTVYLSTKRPHNFHFLRFYTFEPLNINGFIQTRIIIADVHRIGMNFDASSLIPPRDVFVEFGILFILSVLLCLAMSLFLALRTSLLHR